MATPKVCSPKGSTRSSSLPRFDLLLVPACFALPVCRLISPEAGLRCSWHCDGLAAAQQALVAAHPLDPESALQGLLARDPTVFARSTAGSASQSEVAQAVILPSSGKGNSRLFCCQSPLPLLLLVATSHCHPSQEGPRGRISMSPLDPGGFACNAPPTWDLGRRRQRGPWMLCVFPARRLGERDRPSRS